MKSLSLPCRRLAVLAGVFYLVLFCLVPHAWSQQDIEEANTLLEQAKEALSANDIPRLIGACSKALKIYQTIPDTEKQQVDCYMGIGIALLSLDNYEEAIERYEQALSLYQTIPDTEREQANCYNIIGKALHAIGKYEEAIAKWEQALRIFQTIKGTEMEQVVCYRYIGIALGNMDKYDEAIVKYDEALRAYKTIPGTEMGQAACYMNIGIAFREIGKYDEAIERYEQALKIFQTKDMKEEQAHCYVTISGTLLDMGQYDEAIAKLEQALRIYETIPGTEEDRVGCYSGIVLALVNMSRYDEAIAKLEQKLRIYETIPGTEREQAGCYVSICEAFVAMGEYQDAIEKGQQALRFFQTIPGTTEEEQAACYQNIGLALVNMSRYDEAIAKWEQALRIYETITGTERDQAGCYMNIGEALLDMGDYFDAFDAIEKYQQALSIYKTIKGTEEEQAGCYMNIGVALENRNKYDEAIVKYDEALRAYKTILGTEMEQADCYVSIGLAFHEIGKYEEMKANHKQALSIYKTIKGTEREQARCYTNIGLAFGEIGKYKDGIANHQGALRFLKTLKGTEREQANCYNMIGIAFTNLGQHEEGIVKQQQGLRILKTIDGTEERQGWCWDDIGDAHLRAGRFSEAIAAYQYAYKFGIHFLASRGLGAAYRFRNQPGDKQKAVQAFLNAVQEAELSHGMGLPIEYQAQFFEDLSKFFPDFVSLLVELAAKKSVVREPEVLRWAQDGMSETALLEAAFHFADRGKGRALEDALRERALAEALREEAWVIENPNFARTLTSIWALPGITNYHELSVVLRRITSPRVSDPKLAALPDNKLDSEYRKLSLEISKLTALREQLSTDEVERRQKLTQDIESMQYRREDISWELWKRTALGRYVAPEFRKPMEMAKELPPETAVLQYSVGEKEGWVLILTPDGVSAHRLGAETPALPELLPREEAQFSALETAWEKRPEQVGLEGLVGLVQEGAGDVLRWTQQDRVEAEQERAILERFGEVVLPEPAISQLRQKGIRQLLIIPDGLLHYIPFAMLRLAGADKANDAETHYLIEEFSLRYIPAMTTLETVRKQKEEREQKRQGERLPLLAFANPDFGGKKLPSDDTTTVARLRSFRRDYYGGGGLRLTPLPETEKEAVQVGSQFGQVEKHEAPTIHQPQGQVVVYTGKGACEEQLKRLLIQTQGVVANWRYILFSTHGFADPHNGMLSCIALSSPSPDSEEDGFLQAQEMVNLQLDCDLVMLSACQTGLGRMRGGEGLVGLSVAFFYAGAESVCASLWDVPSPATRQLVTEFFKHLKEGKLDKAEALRQAQLTVMRSGREPKNQPADYSAPLYWGAFVLMGE